MTKGSKITLIILSLGAILIVVMYLFFKNPLVADLLVNNRIYIPTPEKVQFERVLSRGFAADRHDYYVLEYSLKDVQYFVNNKKYRHMTDTDMKTVVNLLEHDSWPFKVNGEANLFDDDELNSNPILINEDSLFYLKSDMTQDNSVVSQYVLIIVDPTDNLVYLIISAI